MAKAPVEIRSLARRHTAKALQTLANIMESGECPPAARVSAAQALLDRGWGKAPQELKVAVQRAASELGDDELAAIASSSSEGIAEAPVDPSQIN